ncbi:unnamed protein product [Paramecium octaurelia]|uniref:Uncharacterized protein n=1 Tax=Paramecium octaurelia TaxID=43137 RepID=A0A8S1VRB2_PAROT|nr:unnamed protein product [Paramecium octaurelia]
MKILLIIIISARFSQSLENADCDKNEAQMKSILRGQYKDVASYFNGALLSSIRANIQSPSQNIDCSPLRNLNYLYVTGLMGHLANFVGGSIIIEFRQTYEINKIKFWMLDDANRIYYIKIFATGADRKTENLLYQGQVPFGVNTFKFQDQFISKLRFYNQNGNSINQFMSIVKIQAFYEQ